MALLGKVAGQFLIILEQLTARHSSSFEIIELLNHLPWKLSLWFDDWHFSNLFVSRVWLLWFLFNKRASLQDHGSLDSWSSAELDEPVQGYTCSACCWRHGAFWVCQGSGHTAVAELGCVEHYTANGRPFCGDPRGGHSREPWKATRGPVDHVWKLGSSKGTAPNERFESLGPWSCDEICTWSEEGRGGFDVVDAACLIKSGCMFVSWGVFVDSTN